MSALEDAAAVICRFVRGRNALLAVADFGPVFMDCYLHLGRTNVVLAHGVDEKLKLQLASLALHAATLPRAVTCAWTLHLEEEGLNLFTVAENPTGRLTGQVFADNVRSVGGNILHAETVVAGGVRRRSSVEFSGSDMLRAAEAYYRQSEQRPARFFALGGDEFAVLAAQPDCDVEWLESVETEEVQSLAGGDGRDPLETRLFRFECGCTPARLAAAIGPALGEGMDEVFAGDSHLQVDCPRCGLRHELARQDFAEKGNA